MLLQVCLRISLCDKQLDYAERAFDRMEGAFHSNPVVERYWAQVDEADQEFAMEKRAESM